MDFEVAATHLCDVPAFCRLLFAQGAGSLKYSLSESSAGVSGALLPKRL